MKNKLFLLLGIVGCGFIGYSDAAFASGHQSDIRTLLNEVKEKLITQQTDVTKLNYCTNGLLKDVQKLSDVEQIAQQTQKKIDEDIECLQNEYKSLSGIVNKLGSRHNSLSRKEHCLSSKYESLQTDVNKLKTRHGYLSEKVHYLRSENESLKSAVSELESQNKFLQDQLSKLTSQMTYLIELFSPVTGGKFLNGQDLEQLALKVATAIKTDSAIPNIGLASCTGDSETYEEENKGVKCNTNKKKK